MKPKTRRLLLISLSILTMGIGLALILLTFRDNLVFFYSPSEFRGKHIEAGKTVRIGGMIQENSIKKAGNITTFTVTDFQQELPVRYEGITPPMFRERQGVVAEGKWDGHSFIAATLLTKHDEKYMPPEIARTMAQSMQGKMK